jgi:ribosomal protein S18 acetylase RimI-like enzyme
MNIVIREATLKDAQSITQVNIQAWQESYQGIVDQEYLDNLPAIFAKKLALRQQGLSTTERTIHLVAQLEASIVGFCDAGVAKNCLLAKGEIYRIYLLREFQGLGVGKSLFYQAVDFLRLNHLTPITLLTLKDNVAAKKFYAKQGGVEMSGEDVEIGEKIYKQTRYIFNI